MDKILIVVFEDESKAYEGSQALQELQEEGSINLYAQAVIVRDAEGKVQMKQSSDMRPVGTAVGLVTGSLIGLLGGPVGLAIGAGAGMAGGLLYDLAEVGVSQDFLEEVGQSLRPGKAAVIAELWEDWMLPVDSKMESLGGVVFRRMRRDSLDRQVEWDITTLKAEIDELEAEHDRASGGAKIKLQAKIDALQEQAAKARGERKAKLEKRIAELKADQQRRSEQLKQAGQHIRETLEA